MGLLNHQSDLNARDVEVEHRRVYCLDELRADVEAAGLKVVTTGGVFMKPLSNSQMQDQWTDQMIEAFFELGKDFQQHAAELFVVAEVS